MGVSETGEGELRRPWLHFDEDADVRLAEALTRRGYDAQTTVAAGLLAASDEEQLRYAASQQRVLVTHNVRHFPEVHCTWIQTQGTHWGIIILIGQSAVGVWLRRMEELFGRYSVKELRNHLFFLGAEFDGLR